MKGELVMKYYILTEQTKQDYNGFLLCTTVESVFTYLHNIENEPIIKRSKGKLLIDQLLVTGNGKNRYISCIYNCGELELNSAQYVVPDEYYKKLSVKILKKNMGIVKNSILTSHQKECIAKGITF